jgi:formylglycine-generating enzyme
MPRAFPPDGRRSALLIAIVILASCNKREDLPRAPSHTAPAEAAASAEVDAPASSPPSTSQAPVASAPDAAPPGPCPAEMADLGGSCIDLWEDHLIGEADGKPHPHFERPERGVVYKAVSAPSVFPQAYINRSESQQACERAGKRLCTLAEWYRACQGPNGFVYPYGNEPIGGKCNSSKQHLLSRLFGNNPRNWSYEKHFNSPVLDQEPGFLARTGEYTACESGFHVFDLVGNLHEWISDKVDPELLHKIPVQKDVAKKVGPRTGNAIFMGGFFSTTSEHGPGCRFVTIGHEARYHDYSTGFRCCKDANRAASVSERARNHP